VLVEVFVHDEQERRRKRLLKSRDPRITPDEPQSHPNAQDDEDEDRLPLRGTTCGICDARSPMRRACWRIVRSGPWAGVVLIAVLLSCVHLVYDNPLVDPDSDLAHELALADLGLTAFFALEAALKVVVQGFVCGQQGAYLSNGWNRLDFFILCTSLLAIVTDANASFVRLLRVLRPLRLVRRVPGMAAIFLFFQEALMEVANVAGVVLFFQLIFAVIGVQLFMDVDFAQRELSFEAFPSAMMLLFASATGDSWSSYMWTAMDAPTAPGQPPARNDVSPAAVYFVAWLYIGQWSRL
jgi:hypothetical protein